MSTFEFLKGVYNITPTPFLPDGALDEAGSAAWPTSRSSAACTA